MKPFPYFLLSALLVAPSLKAEPVNLPCMLVLCVYGAVKGDGEEGSGGAGCEDPLDTYNNIKKFSSDKLDCPATIIERITVLSTCHENVYPLDEIVDCYDLGSGGGDGSGDGDGEGDLSQNGDTDSGGSSGDGSDAGGTIIITDTPTEEGNEQPDTSGREPLAGTGIIWKPRGNDGNLVVITPTNIPAGEAYLILPDGTIEQGNYIGLHNGGRPHYRFDKHGSQYPSGTILVINGVEYPINNPANRIDQNS